VHFDQAEIVARRFECQLRRRAFTADGAGRVVLTRVDEVLARYSGALETDGRLGEAVRGLREEWW
jgi:hypothetical protein